MKTFGEHLETFLPAYLLGTFSRKFVGITLGFVHDAIATGVSDALRIGWVKESSVTVDALPHLGRNFNLPAYPIETPAQHIERMSGAWDLWQFAGDETPIESQLATLGFAGATVYTPDEWVREPFGYWSQFWLFFPAGSHPVTGPGPTYGGGGVYGGGLVYGPTGITLEQLYTIRKVIAQWKPVDWICRGILFEISGATYGSGHVYGEAGLTYGGGAVVEVSAT